MKKSYLLVVAFLFSAMLDGVSHAQSTNENRAKAYFFSAQDSFARQDYVNALNYLQSAENLLGKSNARIEGLRAKTLYHKGDIQGAKLALDRFFAFSPSTSLTREMTGYARDIEAKYSANKAQILANQRAQAEKERQARLAADKRAREQAAVANRQSEHRQFIRAVVTETLHKCATVDACAVAIQTEEKEKARLARDMTVKRGSPEYTDLAINWRSSASKIRVMIKRQCDLGEAESCTFYADTITNLKADIANKRAAGLTYSELDVETDVLNGTSCATKPSASKSQCINDIMIRLYQKSCYADYAYGCLQAGNAWNYNNFKHEKALMAYQSGCRRHNGEACFKAAEHLQVDGSWTASAIRYAHQACEEGLPVACRQLAEDTFRGRAKMTKSKKDAKLYHQKYCDIMKYDRKKCSSSYEQYKTRQWF